MASGNENMSDGFQLVQPSQVTISAEATCQSAVSGRWEMKIFNSDTGIPIRTTCGVLVESATPKSLRLGCSLWLPKGNYTWEAAFQSQMDDGVVKPKQQGLHTIENQNIMPPGYIGSVSVSGSQRPYLYFSGSQNRKISIGAEAKVNVREGSLAKLSLMFKDSALPDNPINYLVSEVHSSVPTTSPLWTELRDISIKAGIVYWVLGAVGDDKVEIQNVTIRLEG